MFKKIIFILFVLFFSLPLNAQVIILHDNVKADSLQDKFGANYRHFLQLTIGYGALLGKPAAPGAEIKQPHSFFIDAGMRYKLKLASCYAFIFELDYHLQNFSLKQNSTKIFTDNTIHDKEKLLLNSMGLSFLNRINFGRRGNRIGKYADAGLYAGYVFRNSHATFDKSSDPGFSKGVIINRQRALTFVNNYNYGVVLRCGRNSLALVGYYRLSDLFKQAAYNYPELPRFMLGLELSTM